MSQRLSNALEELMKASQEVYGRNIVLDIQFNVALGQSRNDLTGKSIMDFIDIDLDEDVDGNK